MTEQIMSHTSPPVGSDITVEPLHEITLSVNGAPHTATAPARRLLSDFLRRELGLTGTHVGCSEHGLDDVLVARATTEVAGHHFSCFGLGR